MAATHVKESNTISMVPALVIGAGVNGLGVVRSLAQERIPIWLADTDMSDPTMRTRHATSILMSSMRGPAVVDELLALRQRFAENPVLFLTREATVAAVCSDLERIRSCYRISMPRTELMEQLMDKAWFQYLAEQHGFPIARAVHLVEADDLLRAERLIYPCVLKPVEKTAKYEERFQKAYKVDVPAHLRAIVRDIGDAAVMIVQEWIEGGDDQIYFCLLYRDSAARTVASFTGRKLRSWPPGTGGTASCVPAPEHGEELTRLTDGFFSAVGFFGIGSMEYKWDSRTQRFMMIEPTVGRTDFQEEIAVLNGVNIPYAAYRAELGLTGAAPRTKATPAAWAVPQIDRWSSESQSEHNRGFPRGLRRYDAYWRLDDPLPWCYTIARRIKARLSYKRRQQQ
jgi:D-aspartate ligase